MVGLLATIGIERGKPFNPQGKMKAAMERGVKDAYFYMQQMDARLFASSLYWPDRHWSFVMVPDEKNGFEFVTEDARRPARRAGSSPFYPKVMMPGRVGTVYLAPTADRTGQPLEPGRNYRLRVPRDVPARQFWSLTLYDNATWAFIRNPLDRNGLGSLDRDRPEGERRRERRPVLRPGCAGGLREQLAADHGKEALSLVPALRPRRGILGQVLRAAGRGAGRVENGELLYSRFDSSRAEEFLKRRGRDQARTSSRVSSRQSRRSSWKSRSDFRATASS